MDLKTLLQDPVCCLSIVWEAVKKLLGETVHSYEPDVFRIELTRRGIDPTDNLMSKILAAQTITKFWYWLSDHDVLFAFALACDGIPAASDMIHQPTVEQLAWAMREIAALHGEKPDDEQGFDPDTIDPAIATILHHDGWVLAPKELEFCQGVLSQFTKTDWEFTEKVRNAWSDLSKEPATVLRQKIDKLNESALTVQLRHLADCRLSVEEREQQRAQQHVWLTNCQK